MRKTNKWRWSTPAPSIWGIPAVAFLPLIIVMYWLKFFPYTLYAALSIIGACAIMNKYGYTLKVFIGKVRCILRGKKIHARPWWMRKKFNKQRGSK